jgi:alkylation response protein AidB-like acyl-CoA dehydrogenase
MPRLGSAALSGDDSALPEHELALLDQARALVPRLTERAAAASAARNIPPETIAEYHEAGILRILLPRRFGGLQGRFSLFSRIVEELTFGCASSAWVYAVLAEHQWIIARYPEQAQIDVWGDNPLAVASSSLAPRAAAKKVPGGWRLSGRYTFSSGCDHAQWAILGAFLGEAGDPRMIAYLLVPLTDLEIVDDWHCAGPRRHRQQIAASARRFRPRAALRARAQHQIGWAMERLCELSGARWVYDTDPLQELRRDVMTILTHHAASRAAAFAPYGRILLSRSD